LIVVGGHDPMAVDRVARLYADLPKQVCKVGIRTAEMIKYSCNAFHAVKIAFANEIGSLSSRMNIDPEEVMATLCDDKKLNVSAAYLKPGFAFGGSCLPKDLRALTYRAGRLDLHVPLLQSVLSSNDKHLFRSIQAVLDLPAKRLGFVGLAFKENTDDLRESPTISILENLIGKGKDVRVFDPHIQMDNIYGSNRNFVLQQIPHIGRLMHSGIEETLAWADYIVVAQPLSLTLKAKVFQSGLPVIDLTAPSLAYITDPALVCA
jgi:GDP-mannose 6-dehydrogenase